MRYSDLFQGRREVYAAATEGGRSYFPIWKVWGAAEVREHLRGGQSLGVYLLRPEDNAVHLLAFDFDSDDQRAVQAVAQQLLTVLPDTCLLLERTGGRGWHLWVLLNDWLAAAVVRTFARRQLAALDLPLTVEIYPKQDVLAAKEGLGNLVRLPLGKHPRTGQPGQLYNASLLPIAVDPADPDPELPLLPVSIELISEAVQQATGGRNGERVAAGDRPAEGALPCIAKFQAGVPQGFRDEAMFRLAAYLYRQSVPREAVLLALGLANAGNQPPLEAEELRLKVESAFSGGGYGLPCSSAVVGLDSPFCDPRCPAYAKAKARALGEAGGTGAAAGGGPRLLERNGGYVLLPGNGKELILSNFLLQPLSRLIVSDDSNLPEVLRLELTTRSDFLVLDLPVTTFDSRSHLLRALSRADIAWFGTDQHCQLLKAWLMRNASQLPVQRAVTKLGRLPDQPLWVMPEGLYSTDGLTDKTAAAVVYFRPAHYGEVQVKVRSLPDGQDPAEVLRRLPQLNGNLASMLKIIGWCFAVPFKPQLVQRLGHFPLLMLFGTKGGGKTQLMQRAFLPLFGYSSRESQTHFCDTTRFVMTSLGASTLTVPLFWDEYRPNAMPQTRLLALWDLWRHAYAQDVDSRGQADQTQLNYRQTAPLVVAGEEMVSDPALLERLVQVYLAPEGLTPESKKIFHHLPDMQALSWEFVRHGLATDWEALLPAARQAVQSYAELPPRLHDNLLVLALGLLSWRQLCQGELPDNWGELLGDKLPGLTKTGRTRIWSDDFLLDLAATLEALGPQSWGELETTAPGRRIMWLNLRSAYGAWCRDLSRRAQNPVALDTLRRQLKERGSFVLKQGVQRRMPSGINSRVCSIDVDGLRTAVEEEDE